MVGVVLVCWSYIEDIGNLLLPKFCSTLLYNNSSNQCLGILQLIILVIIIKCCIIPLFIISLYHSLNENLLAKKLFIGAFRLLYQWFQLSECLLLLQSLRNYSRWTSLQLPHQALMLQAEKALQWCSPQVHHGFSGLKLLTIALAHPPVVLAVE